VSDPYLLYLKMTKYKNISIENIREKKEKRKKKRE
jgi:hypothetical protein